MSAACGGEQNVEEGYNSEDEYSHVGVQLTEEEWQEKDRRFERLIKKKKGLSIRQNYNQVLTVFPLHIHFTIWPTWQSDKMQMQLIRCRCNNYTQLTLTCTR